MRQLQTKTDKALLSRLPRFAFEGRIEVVQSQRETNRALRLLSRASLIGIDTETRPSFRRGNTHKVALLQASTEDICFLFRLNFIGFPEELAALLANPEICKVGLSLKDDFHQLSQLREGFTPQNIVEIQSLAEDFGIEDRSLQKLFANFFGKYISKSQQLTNWEADVLTDKQKRYAATDAYACILLHKEMTHLLQTGNYQLLPPSEG